MTLELPSDLYPFLPDNADTSHYRTPGVYSLALDRPNDPVSAWDNAYDHRPPWFSQFIEADEVVYVGSSMDVLGRLTDHKDGEKRVTVLTDICDIRELRSVWWVDGDRDEVQREERRLARWLREAKPTWYIRQQ